MNIYLTYIIHTVGVITSLSCIIHTVGLERIIKYPCRSIVQQGYSYKIRATHPL